MSMQDAAWGSDTAEAKLRRAIIKAPLDPLLRMKLARFLTKRSRSHEAEVELRTLLEQQPLHEGARVELSRLLHVRGRRDEARSILETFPPGSSESAALLLADLLIRNNNYAEASGHLAETLVHFPTSVALEFACARIDMLEGRETSARARLEAVIKRLPGHTDALAMLEGLMRQPSQFEVEARRPVPWPKRGHYFENVEDVFRTHVLGKRKPVRLLDERSEVVTLGSCFAVHVARRLQDRGIPTFNVPVGEDINSTYGNLYFLQWVMNGPSPPYGDTFERIYGAQVREDLRRRLERASLFVFTLGVAPCFFDRESGAFQFSHGTQEETRLLSRSAEFRTTTVEENVANLTEIHALLLGCNPRIQVVLTVSPVPLAGTLEMDSAVEADAVSKSVMRVTAFEFLRRRPVGAHYWPSFEMVRWCGAHLPRSVPPAFGADDSNQRHVSNWLVDLIMKLFVEHFGPVADNPAAEVRP